jgi:hypothetical protein
MSLSRRVSKRHEYRKVVVINSQPRRINGQASVGWCSYLSGHIIIRCAAQKYREHEERHDGREGSDSGNELWHSSTTADCHDLIDSSVDFRGFGDPVECLSQTRV